MLWHKLLGHVSISKICKPVGLEAMLGIPLLKNALENVCSEISGGITTRKKECRDYAKMIANMCFTSQI